MVCYFLSPWQLEVSRRFSKKAAIKKELAVKKLIEINHYYFFWGVAFA